MLNFCLKQIETTLWYCLSWNLNVKLKHEYIKRKKDSERKRNKTDFHLLYFVVRLKSHLIYSFIVSFKRKCQLSPGTASGRATKQTRNLIDHLSSPVAGEQQQEKAAWLPVCPAVCLAGGVSTAQRTWDVALILRGQVSVCSRAQIFYKDTSWFMVCSFIVTLTKLMQGK